MLISKAIIAVKLKKCELVKLHNGHIFIRNTVKIPLLPDIGQPILSLV